MLESKLDKIAGLLRKKLTSFTKLQLQTGGRITRFPKASRQRYVLPARDQGEYGIMPGSYVRQTTYKGSFSLSTDVLPALNDSTVIEVQEQIFTVMSSNSDRVYLSRVIDEVQKDTQIFFKSYFIQIDGDYEEGIQQMLIRSLLPVIPGDQWYIRNPKGDIEISTVIKATKTSNLNQWDVILKAPILFYIKDLAINDEFVIRDVTGYFNPKRGVYYLYTKPNGMYQCSFTPQDTESSIVPITIHPYQIQSIYRNTQEGKERIFERDIYTHIILTNDEHVSVQVSSSIYWESIPVDGPAILSIPSATHLKDTKAIAINCIQYSAANEVVHSVFNMERRFKINSGQISAHSWLNAQIIEGTIDYIPGTIRFIPTRSGWCIAKLHFLDTLTGSEIVGWTVSVMSAGVGRLNFSVNGVLQGFDLVKGSQYLTLFCPDRDISWIEASTNTDILMGGLTSLDQISHINLAMHVFNTDHLGSHIFGRPSMHCLIKDPSLTWAKVGLSGVNRGYMLYPAILEDYQILSL